MLDVKLAYVLYSDGQSLYPTQFNPSFIFRGLDDQDQEQEQEQEQEQDDDLVFLKEEKGGHIVRLPDIHILETKDRNIILQNRSWLSDIHINLAHALLKKQFPEMHGLEKSTLSTFTEFSPCQGRPFVQIVNTCGNHWVAITNIFTGERPSDGIVNADLYDSLYRNINPDVQKFLVDILQLESGNIYMPACHRQPDNSQCGVFAIATATALLFGQDPSGICYDLKLMRPHLIECLDKQHLKPFPHSKLLPQDKLEEKVVIIS